MKEAKRRYVRKPRVVDEEFRAVLESLATDGKDFATVDLAEFKPSLPAAPDTPQETTAYASNEDFGSR